MPLFIAKKLCPHILSLPLKPELYIQASKEIFGILEKYGQIAPASLDEACKQLLLRPVCLYILLPNSRGLVCAGRRGHDRLLRQQRRHPDRGYRSHARRGFRDDGIDRLCWRLAEQDALENRGRHQQAERAIRHRPDAGSVPGLHPRPAAPQVLRHRSRHRDAPERNRTRDGRRHLHAPSQVVPHAGPPPVPLAPQPVPRARLEKRQTRQAWRPQVVRSREDVSPDERPRRTRQHDQADCQVAREGCCPLRVLRTDHHPFDQARSVYHRQRGVLRELERS